MKHALLRFAERTQRQESPSEILGQSVPARES
jgi:hypothetical protein